MKKSEFNKIFKTLLDESRDGFYGYSEMKDKLWYYYNNEQLRNNHLWKEVKRLRKKLGVKS